MSELCKVNNSIKTEERNGIEPRKITMAKEITQIIERERCDGYKEAIITGTNSETGNTVTKRVEWYYDGDRGVRVDMAIQEIMQQL